MYNFLFLETVLRHNKFSVLNQDILELCKTSWLVHYGNNEYRLYNHEGFETAWEITSKLEMPLCHRMHRLLLDGWEVNSAESLAKGLFFFSKRDVKPFSVHKYNKVIFSVEDFVSDGEKTGKQFIKIQVEGI